ncbi:protein induced by osmotic stress [Scheffersomyces coipomensis]|uniref:protein induced by osmotic stress n=1 Tax=Scheffersomyces coipomensis TaxID=1788519 RepID=UPI00315DE46D
MTATTVFVSGATGYIAQTTVVQLLEKGYKVVGSVRSTEKGEQLAKNLNNKNFSYEIVKVLEVEGAFDQALKNHPETTVFLHTASPFTFDVKDPEKELLIPAIDGTKNVLASIKKVAPQIKKVILTSSIFGAAHFPQISDPNFDGGENTWNPITYEESKQNAFNAYSGSKYFAEKAAWDFVEKEKPNFTLAAILPVYVFGPQAFESGLESLNTSAQIPAQVLSLTPESALPDSAGAYIDVRDVAKAHILAFEKEEAAGKRFLLAAKRFDFQLILDVVRENFPDLADKLPVGTPGSTDFSAWKNLNANNTYNILNFEFVPYDKTIVDSIKQLKEYNAKK